MSKDKWFSLNEASRSIGKSKGYFYCRLCHVTILYKFYCFLQFGFGYKVNRLILLMITN